MADHTKYGKHRGRRVFALDRDCSICQESFGLSETVSLKCGQSTSQGTNLQKLSRDRTPFPQTMYWAMGTKRRNLSFVLQREEYARRMVVGSEKQLLSLN